MTQSAIEDAIRSAGRADPRTIENYQDNLKSHGILLPHPFDPGKWLHGVKKFAIICEQNEEIDVDELERIMWQLDQGGRLSVEEYKEGLPEDYNREDGLKIEKIDNDF